MFEIFFSFLITTADPLPEMPYNGHLPLTIDPMELPLPPDINCLAVNMYFEARNQGDDGMAAVANVTINRVEDHRFPNKVCSVVYQKNEIGCQFSWVCAEEKYGIYNKGMYKKSKEIAWKVLTNQLPDNTGGSLFYHAVYVNPKWPFKKVTQIGEHIFYRL